jgi:hypothetical protein
VWLDYDWGGKHAHSDGMNLGMFAYGLDLLPDFGYPPVNYGGWDAPRAVWYTLTTAHNTVAVDNVSLTWAEQPSAGRTTLWADGQAIRAVRASAPGVYAECPQFERTVFMVDLSPERFYLLDICRVAGGKDHLKSVGSHFGAITTRGLTPAEGGEIGEGAIVRNLRTDPAPQPGWSVEWTIEDRYRLAAPDADVRLRCTDLTSGAEAMLGEAWVAPGGFGVNNEAWVPRVMVRRRPHGPQVSTFVSVLEPYEKQPALAGVKRLPVATEEGELFPDTAVAVELIGEDGARGLLLAVDVENPLKLLPAYAPDSEVRQPEWGVSLHGEACYLQRDAKGNLLRAALFRGTHLAVDGLTLTAKHPVEFVEVAFHNGKPRVVAGDEDAVIL